MAGWMETFAQRGGQLVIHGAAVSDLDYFSRTYDLVLVSAGKGELVSMFGRDASRSPYDAPQRALAVSYVHGLGPRPEHPEYDAVRCNLVPGVGELFVMPTLTTSGRADILFWEGIPGGPLDVFQGVKDPARAPGPDPGADGEVHALGVRAGHQGRADRRRRHARRAATPRPSASPIGRLPGGGLVLGVADVVVANDPITGQGSNSASKCAAAYLASILEHGDEPFDEEWMQATFDRYWDTAQHVTKWTNAMLGPAAGARPQPDRRGRPAPAGRRPVRQRLQRPGGLRELLLRAGEGRGVPGQRRGGLTASDQRLGCGRWPLVVVSRRGPLSYGQGTAHERDRVVVGRARAVVVKRRYGVLHAPPDCLNRRSRGRPDSCPENTEPCNRPSRRSRPSI